jgi:hypothetical protein
MSAHLNQTSSLHHQFEQLAEIQWLLGHDGHPGNGSSCNQINHTIKMKSISLHVHGIGSSCMAQLARGTELMCPARAEIVHRSRSLLETAIPDITQQKNWLRNA